MNHSAGKSSSPVLAGLKQLLRRPSFVVVAGVLLLAAVTLNAATEFLQLHFKKLPVEIGRPLTTIPTTLGPWVQVSKDEPLPVDNAHMLGTDVYVYRDYVDSRLVPLKRIHELFDDKTMIERRATLSKVMAENPNAVLNMGITYYTGMVDTVAHIPDRCYIADDFRPTSYNIVKWDAFNDRSGRSNGGDARLISFEDQSANRATVPRSVCYFFHCNGQYESDPIGVRKRLGNLFERFGYYSKVELMMQLHDGDAAGKIMDDFLKHALPEIEKCLPDWASVAAASRKS